MSLHTIKVLMIGRSRAEFRIFNRATEPEQQLLGLVVYGMDRVAVADQNAGHKHRNRTAHAELAGQGIGAGDHRKRDPCSPAPQCREPNSTTRSILEGC